ncbi:hypothetical protein C1H46_045749 [Malus baccata]|uniref:Uncharacterized protein n=1 Tax=Malus baccata TaxID=106549 RepID=A0A540K394_MALBA|nr:hypothetical protein C1H46_045749 [Malus baccata]
MEKAERVEETTLSCIIFSTSKFLSQRTLSIRRFTTRVSTPWEEAARLFSRLFLATQMPQRKERHKTSIKRKKQLNTSAVGSL